MQVETVVIRWPSKRTKQVSKVTREDGKSITFIEKMSKKESVRQALMANADAWK